VAVVVATIAAMVLGFIWYGPLFGKKWMEAQGIKEQSKKMPVGPMVGMLVTAFIMAFVLAQVFAWTAIRSMGDALR
jgi:fructose-specific phosphotransferase system IIC component